MPYLINSAEVEDLAEYVREKSLPAHHRAESRPFIEQLMRGERSLADYPRLARMRAIESDLARLGVSDWRREHTPLSATSAYVEHLRGIAGDDVLRYLAHHYTRYLGDLSGGQAIARLVARHYGATPDQLKFYRFDEIGELVPYKRSYRFGLNRLGYSRKQAELLVTEVDVAFSASSAIFDELH